MRKNLIFSTIRGFSSKPKTNGNIQPMIYNRNPRNLEKLQLEKKPCGYTMDLDNVPFWNKMELLIHSRHIAAHLIHHTQKVLVEASTAEWAIRKHLYSAKDKQAFITLAQVFAERCLESGYSSFYTNVKPNMEDSNAGTFLSVLTNEGIVLKEAPEFDPHNVWQKSVRKKPWTVLES